MRGGCQVSDSDDLIAQYARQGVNVVGAVPAFTGMYPLFGAWGNWELLFTRHRLLARTAEGMQEWTARTGQSPGRLLNEDKGASVELALGRRRYDRVLIAGRPFWVHRRYRRTVQDWSAAPAPVTPPASP